MPLGNPINPIVRKALDERRKVLNREANPNPYTSRGEESKKSFQRNIQKTTYIYMISAPVFEEDLAKRADYPTGTIILGNQEYSLRKSMISSLWSLQ